MAISSLVSISFTALSHCHNLFVPVQYFIKFILSAPEKRVIVVKNETHGIYIFLEYLYFYELGVDGVFTEFMPAAFEARNVFIESQHQAKLFAQRTNEQHSRLDQHYSVDLTKFEVVMISLACAIGGLIIGVFLTYVIITQKARAKEPVFSLTSLPSVKKITPTKKR